MAIPDYADERSFKNFSRGLVGRSHGDDGSAYKTFWNSSCKAPATKMIVDGRNNYCAYCGNEGFPLQPYFKGSFSSEGSDKVTGYTCICVDAMDEIEFNIRLKELISKQNDELYELKQTAPQMNVNVLQKIAENKLKKAKERLDSKFGRVQDYLSDFGLSVTGEKDNEWDI